MSINRFLTVAGLTAFLFVPEAIGQVRLIGNIQEQVTTTTKHDLLSWFSDPARVSHVIRSGDQTNFLRGASFRQFGQYQPQGSPPVPPQPADPVPGTIPTRPVQPTPSVAPPAIRETLPITPPVPSATGPAPAITPMNPLPSQALPSTPMTSQPITAPTPLTPAAPAQAPTPGSATAPVSGNGIYYFDSKSVGSGCTSTPSLYGQSMYSGGAFGAAGRCGTGCGLGGGNSCGNQCGVSGVNSCGSQCGGGGNLCDRGCNSWTVQTGAVFLFRGRPNTSRFVTDPLAPGQTMDARDFSFGMQTGLEVAATKHRAFGQWDFETRYFGIEDWSALQSRLFTGNPIQLGTAVPTFVSGPRRVVSRYSSDLHNFEWNLTRPFGTGNRLLFGARHLQINESLMTRFRSTLAPPISAEDLVVRTQNRLYGLQIGLARTVCGNRCFCLEAYGKSGIYANDANQRSSLVNFVDPVVEFRQRARETELSFVHELGLRYRYRLCDKVNFYAGYRGLWAQNVALASDQISRVNFAGLGSNLFTQGDVFYHGGMFGVEILF